MTGEAMAKRGPSWDPDHQNWEYLNLSLSPGGAKISSRGKGEVSNDAGSCLECHEAARTFDYVCRGNHGCDPLPLDGQTLEYTQTMDPRCRPVSVMTPEDPAFAERVREGFQRQTVMRMLGASLARVEPGVVEIALPFRADLCQQHGFLHAGIVTTIVDSACGFAAFTLMPADASVLSVEFKVNLLNPARGQHFVARGQVVKAGRTITVCQGEVIAFDGGVPRSVATMLGTMMSVRDRPGVTG